MRVSRIGNSLVVRVPASVAATLELREGDDVQVSAIGVKTLGVEREPDVYELLAKLRRLREAQALPEDLPLERLLGLAPSVSTSSAPSSPSAPIQVRR
jgi:antitoxin MazE